MKTIDAVAIAGSGGDSDVNITVDVPHISLSLGCDPAGLSREPLAGFYHFSTKKLQTFPPSGFQRFLLMSFVPATWGLEFTICFHKELVVS